MKKISPGASPGSTRALPGDEPAETVVYSRRNFIKTVIAGGTGGAVGVNALAAMAGCPVMQPGAADAGAAAVVDAGPPAPRFAFAKALAGETFDRCHAVRDKIPLPAVEPTETVEIVIVGGGPSGLFAAHRMNDRDVLLLEKESETGGNCRVDEWSGVKMSTGGAFYTASEHSLIELLDEIGAKGTLVDGPDSIVIDGQPVKDFFRDGAAQLPWAQRVKDDFRKSRDDLLKLYKTKKSEELDAVSFAKLLEPYAPEVRRFWDSFGQSNWGGTAANTSGYVGCEAYTWAGGAEDARYTFPGGLSGAARKLSDVVKAKLGERLKTSASVTSVEIVDEKGKKPTAIVRWFEGAQPKAVRAKAVIVAAPKYFAKHLVRGLPTAHTADMSSIRYLPFCIFNVCLNAPGPEPAYDNFFIDTPFTDFIPADWIIHAGKGPKDRKTALTVYHPLPEGQRALLLVDAMIADLADGVATNLERHFPGTIPKIAEIRAFRRGHAMYISAPGIMSLAQRASVPEGPVFFANTDRGVFSTFYDAVNAGTKAVVEARKHLGLAQRAVAKKKKKAPQ